MESELFENKLELKPGLYIVEISFSSIEENNKALIFNLSGSDEIDRVKDVNRLKSSDKYNAFEYVPSKNGFNFFVIPLHIISPITSINAQLLHWKVSSVDNVTVKFVYHHTISKSLHDRDVIQLKNECLEKSEKVLREQIYKLKNRNDSIKRTLSFRIGHYLVISDKTAKFFATLPYNLYTIYRDFKDTSFYSKDWFDIDDSPCQHIKDCADKVISYKFKLESDIILNKSDALIQITLFDVKPSRELAKVIGCSYSDSIGLFKYVNFDLDSECEITLKVPNNIIELSLKPRSWYSERKIWFKFVDLSANGQSTIMGNNHADAKKSLKIDNAVAELNATTTLPYIERVSTVDNILREKASAEIVAKYLKQVIDLGKVSTANELLTKVPVKERIKYQKQVKSVTGYVNLLKRLPAVDIQNNYSFANSNGPICLIAHCSLVSHSNGYATRTHEIAKQLSIQHKVIVITRPGYPQDVLINTDFGTQIIDGIEYRTIGGAHYYEDALDEYIEKSSASLAWELKGIQPKAVIGASSFFTSLPALKACRMIGVPFAYEVRGLWEITRASSMPGWGDTERFELESRLEAYTAKQADQVLTITGAVKNEMISRGVDGSKISIVPNAIHENKFDKLIKYKGLKLRKNVPVIGYIGSIVDYEGLDDLITALEIIHANNIDFQLLIAGDGVYLKTLTQIINDSPIKDKIQILGRVPHENVGYLLSKIDITPFPRKPIQVCELVSPLKPFESLIMGKAIVASNVGALAEIFDGKNGLLFEKGNVNSLADVLTTVIQRKDLRASLAEYGRQWVLENRLWSGVGDTYERVINKLQNTHNVSQQELKKPKLKILVYGDVDLNYIDGSSVWASSITRVLSQGQQVEVDFLLKSDDLESKVLSGINNINSTVKIYRPSQFNLTKRLAPFDAVEIISQLTNANGYDCIVLRGADVLKEALARPELIGLIWSYPVDILQKSAAELTACDRLVFEQSTRVLAQSDFLKNRLIKELGISRDKIVDLPPMVPDSENEYLNNLNQKDTSVKRIVYAGKFDSLWATEEMLNTFVKLRKLEPQVELHVYGDKINNRADDSGFKSRIESLLKSDGVVWHQGVTRETVLENLPTYDLAWAWRSAELELNTHEISTKFLEYSSKGVPVICFDGPVYQNILSNNYPLAVGDEAQLLPTIQAALSDKAMLMAASNAVYKAVGKFFFSAVYEKSLEPKLNQLMAQRKSKQVLFAGHDLKFVTRFIEQFRLEGYKVSIDKWQSHNKHNEVESRQKLLSADIIFAEWALGNAVWYSNNKLPHQKLLVRFHRQEIETKYPYDIKLDAVNNFAFIAPHVMRQARELFWNGQEVGEIFENYIDCKALDKPKHETARFTLGMVGIVPRMKRFDKALDVLEALRAKDKRYTLRIKGKLASDFPWMQNRPEEMAYYQELDQRIANSPLLNEAVFFDGHGNDMPDWFQNIGYLLSVSDFEGCHLSVAEGMASGTIPLIWNWEGADEIYPSHYIFPSLENVINFIDDSAIISYVSDMEYCLEEVKKWDVANQYKFLKTIQF